MNVQELIDALSVLDPEMEVETEGCDCDGTVDSVRVQSWFRGKQTPVAYLTRPDDR